MRGRMSVLLATLLMMVLALAACNLGESVAGIVPTTGDTAADASAAQQFLPNVPGYNARIIVTLGRSLACLTRRLPEPRHLRGDAAVLRPGESRVRGEKLLRGRAGVLQRAQVAQLRGLERGQAALPCAEEVAGAAQLEVDLREHKAVGVAL